MTPPQSIMPTGSEHVVDPRNECILTHQNSVLNAERSPHITVRYILGYTDLIYVLPLLCALVRIVCCLTDAKSRDSWYSWIRTFPVHIHNVQHVVGPRNAPFNSPELCVLKAYMCVCLLFDGYIYIYACVCVYNSDLCSSLSRLRSYLTCLG